MCSCHSEEDSQGQKNQKAFWKTLNAFRSSTLSLLPPTAMRITKDWRYQRKTECRKQIFNYAFDPDHPLQLASLPCHYNIHFLLVQILAYVFLRNGSILHHFSSGFLAEAGSHSLWLFVSHFHILNALNGKGLLVFFPGYYYLNAVGVVIVYLYVFMVVRLSTRTLSDWSTAKEVAKNNDDIDDSNV